MHSRQVNLAHLLEIVREGDLIPILFALGIAIAKVFEPVPLGLFGLLKDKVLPARVATDVEPVMACPRPGQQRPGLAVPVLPPAVAFVADDFVVKVGRDDLVEVLGGVLRRVDREVSFPLDFADHFGDVCC